MDQTHQDGGTGGAALRGLAQVIGASLLVTGLVAGGYLAFVGLPDQTPIAAAPAKAEKSVKADKPAKNLAPVKELTYGQRARQVADALPNGNMRDTAREAALVGYLTQMDIPVGREGAPAEAARATCDLLASGTSAETLVHGVKNGAELNLKQARAFLLGASTLYCPSQSSKFRSFSG